MQAIISVFTDFWEFFKTAISGFSYNDVLDIFIVSVMMYYLIKFAFERRAGKLVLGIVFLLILRFIGSIFNLIALEFILQLVFQVGIIALVIVFQSEIRTALEKMGGESLKSLRSITEQKSSQLTLSMINDLCEALLDLSKDKTGALVVIERGTKLGDVIKTGVLVNADMSPFLLKNIFFNKAPLHDGAVIIRDARIYAAGCFLPLSANTDIIKDLGTRHRAAIGMSENSDAIVLVVSEETGVISLAQEGRLDRGFDYMKLRRTLTDLLTADPSIKGKMRRTFSSKKSSDGGEGGESK